MGPGRPYSHGDLLWQHDLLSGTSLAGTHGQLSYAAATLTARPSWRTSAATALETFSARLRDEIDLDTLSTELLAVINQTMQPTRVSLCCDPTPRVAECTRDAKEGLYCLKILKG